MGVHCHCRSIFSGALQKAFEQSINNIGREAFEETFLLSPNAEENRNIFLTEIFGKGAYNEKRGQCPPCSDATKSVFENFIHQHKQPHPACG